MSGDATAAWLETRGALLDDAALVARARAAPLVWAERDGHRRYIDEHDALRGLVRKECVRAALRATRERADERPGLDVAGLSSLTSVACGARVALRTHTAFAKQGAERYGVEHLGRFATCLAEIDHVQEPVLVRACRAYLDVCFFHPFVDGNARAARLAFDFVLARARARLDLVAPLFCVLRPAGDAHAHRAFLRLACTLAEATARRASGEQRRADHAHHSHDGRHA